MVEKGFLNLKLLEKIDNSWKFWFFRGILGSKNSKNRDFDQKSAFLSPKLADSHGVPRVLGTENMFKGCILMYFD